MKTGLVMEGGAMRGMFTCGVMDVMLENGISFDDFLLLDLPDTCGMERGRKENPEKYINSKNSLDILPIIWENILMEIPMRVVSEDAEDVALSGDGWKFITGEEKTENSELSKLKDLL